MGSSESSQDREERKKRIVTVKAPEGAKKREVKPQQKPFGPSRPLTAEERRYAGFDPRQETRQERSSRLATERAKADEIRTRYGSGSGVDERMYGRSGSREPLGSAKPTAASTRTAAMAANREAIAELESRERTAFAYQSRINLQNQIKQLKQGGMPVQTYKPSGEVLTVGVVRDGVFSGRQQFDPKTGITKYDPMRGAYTTRAGARTGQTISQGGSQQTAEPKATETAMTPTPAPTSADASDAIRRAQTLGAGGGTKLRRFLG